MNGAMRLATIQAELMMARSDYRFWASQDGCLTRDERAAKESALARVRMLEAAERRAKVTE